jgi:HPt (histidine-containing phosphotransfer) domain-containing protein
VELEEAVVRRCSGNRELAVRLLRKFAAQSATDRDVITTAATEADHDQIAQTAHRLKGASGNLGLTAISRVAAELERFGKERSAGDVTGLIERLHREIALVEEMSILKDEIVETM